MGYLQDFETALRAQLESEEDLETVIDFVKKAVLESYRNGLAASRPSRERGGGRSALSAGKLKPVR